MSLDLYAMIEVSRVYVVHGGVFIVLSAPHSHTKILHPPNICGIYVNILNKSLNPLRIYVPSGGSIKAITNINFVEAFNIVVLCESVEYKLAMKLAYINGVRRAHAVSDLFCTTKLKA